jgi:competence protein ComEA
MLAWLKRNELLILAVAALLFLSPFAVSAFAGGSSPQRYEFQPGSRLPLGTPIRVHVVGAVDVPGVYTLREGDRVVDAVSAAGGPADDADLDALNLARRIRDEEQVLVPRREGASERPAPLAAGEKLDINTATAAQLDLLPGIGEAYSRRIVDSRRVDGPFESIEELVDRRVLPRATFDRIRDLIYVAP